MGLGGGIDRRTLVGAALAAVAMPLAAASASKGLAALEARAGGRLGFALLHTASGTLTGHRLDEMFGLCSTFKLLLAGLTLKEIEAGALDMATPVRIAAEDPVQWSPVTEPAVGKTLSVGALAEAAQVTSDNGAANLLMRQLGGPAGVTARLRALGDKVTRIDRWEPEMNRVIPPDERDSSSPAAMARTVEKLLLGDALKPAHRDLLAGWMVATRTGLNRLRAGAPPAWTVGDKTGSGWGNGTPNRVNDVAVLWPPAGSKRAPVVVAAFYEAPGAFDAMRPQDEAVLADAMRLSADAFLG